MPALPLATAVTTPAGTWATVVMGGSAARYNNFWQLFARTAGSTRWTLVTPPGTADNGGLVLAGTTGQGVITAFRPSQDLTFTPLSQTSDAGRNWSAVSPLNSSLASTPDSLAAQPGTGRLLALLTSGRVEQAAPDAASWTTIVTGRQLAATPAGRSCGLRTLTGVAYTPAGSPLVAGSCSRPGASGLFTVVGQSWQAAGPALAGADSSQPISVLRLATAGSQTAALLEAGTGSNATLLTTWLTGTASKWTMSPPLATGGKAVLSASFGPAQTTAVITANGRGAVFAAGRWQLLPALPKGTAALATAGGGTTDALAVHRGTLTVWQLIGPGSTWSTAQTVSVPIQYGSSS